MSAVRSIKEAGTDAVDLYGRLIRELKDSGTLDDEVVAGHLAEVTGRGIEECREVVARASAKVRARRV